MLICLLSKQIFSNLLKIRRSSFSKSACLFLRSENRMNKSNTKRHSPKVNAKKEFACIPSHANAQRRYTIHIKNTAHYIQPIYCINSNTQVTCKVKSTTQETRQTNDHKWWLRTFFGHVEMGNIYEQVMFLLHP